MIEKKLGYKFKDKSLLDRALTHASKSSINYERLEFLGDSILDFLVGEYLFKATNEGEGYLTVRRSHFVSENYLATIFDKLELQQDIQMGKSMKNSVPKAVKADVVESIIAAIYLDGGLNFARKFIEKNFELGTFQQIQNDNYKSQLQELVQAGFKCAIKYETEKVENGYEATFCMDEDKICTGFGKDKQSAEQDCAKKAIKILFKV